MNNFGRFIAILILLLVCAATIWLAHYIKSGLVTPPPPKACRTHTGPAVFVRAGLPFATTPSCQ